MKIWLKSILRSNSPSADNHQDKQTPQVDKLANSNRRRSMSARPSRSRSNGDGVRRHKNHMAATAPDPEPELDSGDKPDPIPTIFRRANPFSRARSKSSSGRRPPSPPGHDGNRRACSRSSSRPRARSKSAPRGKSRATSYRSMNSAPMDGTMASSGGRSSERAEKRSSIPRSKSGGNFSNYRMDDDVARRRSFNSNSELAKIHFFLIFSIFILRRLWQTIRRDQWQKCVMFSIIYSVSCPFVVRLWGSANCMSFFSFWHFRCKIGKNPLEI
mmetsp:Transcript_11653/g.23942  ORF Transcript_11653/g.23942 Transcript_11653/m.23942 type:complete len:272 (-) Transcript_11653:52-867(-)